jgi:hypothetical protein
MYFLGSKLIAEMKVGTRPERILRQKFFLIPLPIGQMGTLCFLALAVF